MYSIQPNWNPIRVFPGQWPPLAWWQFDTKKETPCVAENYADEVCFGNFNTLRFFSTNRSSSQSKAALHILACCMAATKKVLSLWHQWKSRHLSSLHSKCWMVGSPRVVHGRNLESIRDKRMEGWRGGFRHFYGFDSFGSCLWKTGGSLSCRQFVPWGFENQRRKLQKKLVQRLPRDFCSKIFGKSSTTFQNTGFFFRHPNHRYSNPTGNLKTSRDGNETGPNSGRPLPRHCSAVASDSPQFASKLAQSKSTLEGNTCHHLLR